MFSAATTGLWRAAHDYLYAQPVEDNVTFATFAWRRARTDAIDAWRTAKHSKAKAEVVPYAEYGYSPKTGKPAFGDSNAGHPGEHICAEAGLDELLDQARNPRDRKMLALISEGMHYREVGEQIGVTESRVCQILKTYRAPTRHLL
jgi:RNA polymerase sigma factor (sigma-70 family)